MRPDIDLRSFANLPCQYFSLVFGDKAAAFITFATIKPFLHDIYQLIHDFNTALSVCTTTNGMEKIFPFFKPPRTIAPYAQEEHEHKVRIMEKHNPNYWEGIVKRHAKNLYYLPVPPRYFERQEGMASKAKSQKQQDRHRVSLKRLLLGDKKQEIPSRKDSQCRRWVLKPMTIKPPEPMPGVPTITVTDPGGKTWWPKDPNSYITLQEWDATSLRVTEQHDGPEGEAHCAAFQEAYRKGLDNKPKGMRPEVLYCCACWARQAEVEEEEARVANEARVAEEQAAAKEWGAFTDEF